MIATLIPIILAIAKWLIERKAAKKLTEREFVEFITAHRKRRGYAGQSAMSWETALAQAQKEMDEYRKPEA